MDDLTFTEKFPELNENQRKWVLSDLQRIVHKYADNESEAIILSLAMKHYIEGTSPVLVEPR